MLKAITNDDEEVASQCEQKMYDTNPTLSSSLCLAHKDLSEDFRDRIHKRFRESLKDTEEEQLTDAKKIGLSDITLKTLRDFRCQLRDLDKEELDLFFYLAWKFSLPQLARALYF